MKGHESREHIKSYKKDNNLGLIDKNGLKGQDGDERKRRLKDKNMG